MQTVQQPEITIRGMRKNDLAFAAQCTSAEGWVSENLATLKGFFLYQPGGCLIAEKNKQPIGMCIATGYGVDGFIGELIVHKDARGEGVGATLLRHAIQILQDQGVGTVYLDGVVKAVQLYERTGFKKICRSWRFSGKLAGRKYPSVRRMTMHDLDQVYELDRRSFGADRSFFLKRRLQLFPELSYVRENQGRISAYLSGRGGKDWLSAGPWVVEEGRKNPEELLMAFALEAGDRQISLGILDSNPTACELVQGLGFMARPDSPWRMALGGSTNLGASSGCYAVGSAAKG
jgi:ribosomal protein S18 acetylase RimI-like enzyme